MRGAGSDKRTPEVVVLGSWTTSEDLWLRSVPSSNGFEVRPGALVENSDSPPRVVIVPDLEHAELSVTQAVVTVLNADAASVERLGHSMRWQPRARWLAAMSRAAAGRISPHLLDRFPVRADATGVYQELHALREQVATPADDLELLRAAMPRLSATRAPASFTVDAGQLVVSLMPSSPSRRRDLALARVARALATNSPTVGAEHVRAAAALLGLVRPTTVPSAGSPEEPLPEHGASGSLFAETQHRPVADAGPPRELEAEPISPETAPALSPYPEDDPAALPPFASLRSKYRPSLGVQPSRGQCIGVQPARDVRNLAMVPTLLEAAKFQVIRRRPTPHGGLLVSAADLRQYRHSHASQCALVLVLDHSCRSGWDAGPALAPYLRWSYRENAAVTVIEFGHREASNELAADRYRAASLLDPRIVASLRRHPGLASPLAHALDLAVQELHRLMRRGRAGLPEAFLVVMTDGRGNVPLNASVLGRPPTGVSRQGVTDSLRIAALARRFTRVHPIVIARDGDLHPELPFELAEALGGRFIAVPPHRASSSVTGQRQ